MRSITNLSYLPLIMRNDFIINSISIDITITVTNKPYLIMRSITSIDIDNLSCLPLIMRKNFNSMDITVNNTIDSKPYLIMRSIMSTSNIHSIAKKLEQAPARFYENMQRYGNTSAASIPIALDEMRRAGQLCPGQTVLCAGFGAGLTWGGVLLRA